MSNTLQDSVKLDRALAFEVGQVDFSDAGIDLLKSEFEGRLPDGGIKEFDCAIDQLAA